MRRATFKGEYLADIFGGNCGVSRAAASRGYATKVWDSKFGASHDLTRKCVSSKLLSDIRCGRVVGACIAPPCGTFSLAHDRACQIRSSEQPWGLTVVLEKNYNASRMGTPLLELVSTLLRLVLEPMSPSCSNTRLLRVFGTHPRLFFREPSRVWNFAFWTNVNMELNGGSVQK